MQKLFSFQHRVPSRHHLAAGPPPHYHRPGFTHSARRVSYNVHLNTKVSCRFFADHGEFRSTRVVVFRRSNILFNQPISYHRRWKLYSTRCLSANGMVKGLILANVVVFLLWKVVDEKFMCENFMLQRDNFNSGRYHTMITSSFSHRDAKHIISNMMELYFCGTRLGKLLGPECLLMVYLSGAFVGSVSFLVQRAFLASSFKNNPTFLVHNNQLLPLDRSKAAALGASDAVIAIMMLDTLLLPLDIIPVKLIGHVRLLMVISKIWEDIKRVKEDGNIARSTHLGGVAAGIIAWAWLRKGPVVSSVH